MLWRSAALRTERGNINREIEVTNQRLRQLKARISKLQNWLNEEAANTEPPTLADVIQDILSRRGQGSYAVVRSLKEAVNMLDFLTANRIMDMVRLEEKVMGLYGRQWRQPTN